MEVKILILLMNVQQRVSTCDRILILKGVIFVVFAILQTGYKMAFIIFTQPLHSGRI